MPPPPRWAARGAPRLSAAADLLEVAFAGDAVMALDVRGRVTRTDGSGTTTVLDTQDPASTPDRRLRRLRRRARPGWPARAPSSTSTATGNVTQADVPGLRGDSVDSIATGGGSVAIGTDEGLVFRWTPAAAASRQLGQVERRRAQHRDLRRHRVRHRRPPRLGAVHRRRPDSGCQRPGRAVRRDHVRASTSCGPRPSTRIQTPARPGGTAPYPETDLYLLSLATGKIYDLHPAPAQQGFPSISGRQLVWQDATFGGDDVFTAAVPGGL